MFFFKPALTVCFVFFLLSVRSASSIAPGMWRAVIERQDGVALPFNFKVIHQNGKDLITIVNAEERLPAADIIQVKDSLRFEMPFFEASFHFKLKAGGNLEGWYLSGSPNAIVWWRFSASKSEKRFLQKAVPMHRISGRWALSITRSNGTERPAIAEFHQNGSLLTGTVLTPSGDYRYLQGVVSNDTMLLSGFNGGQAYLISAVIKNATTLESGLLYAGFSGKETWKAQKNEAAALPDVGNVPDILDSIQALNFTFPDLDSNLISLMDKRFSGKTLIIQTMGSWCPNCMDESRYINELYLKYKHMGVEVIGLAYEYSDDFGRSKKTLLKLRQRLNIQYPLLITGMKLTDSLRTAKTLPQISPIKVFPTTLLLDRQKRIKKIYSGFYGPGSGIHYEMFKKEFETELMRILKSGD